MTLMQPQSDSTDFANIAATPGESSTAAAITAIRTHGVMPSDDDFDEPVPVDVAKCLDDMEEIAARTMRMFDGTHMERDGERHALGHGLQLL